MWRRILHALLRRPGIQRHTAASAPSEYQAEQARILDDYYGCRDKTGDEYRWPIRPLTGDHDRLPEVDDIWRDVALDYLERMYALPDAEVQR